MIEGWHKQHPSLEKMRGELHNELRKHGYITDIFGRRFYLPLWRSYVAVNYLIQGMAAGVLKTAMIKIHKRLKSTGAKMIITLHDELVHEIPNNEKEVVDTITKEMEHVSDDFGVKFPTEHFTSSNNWGECK